MLEGGEFCEAFLADYILLYVIIIVVAGADGACIPILFEEFLILVVFQSVELVQVFVF